VNVTLYADDPLAGPNQLALLLAAAVASVISIFYGVRWKDIISQISKSISSTSSAIIILLIIGALSGSWLISGIVPAMIYYGLQILDPKIFLFASCIICAIVSIASGSSWSTIATVGIALIGIGKSMGFSEGVIAGSIISGAYFGDKMSPLSDTTNLAAAVAETELFSHIKHMMFTTIPSFIITLVIFLFIGFKFDYASTENINLLLESIDKTFNINIYLFLVPIAVIFLIIKKTPAIPALVAGTLLGVIFAMIFQPNIILEVSQMKEISFKAYYMAAINAMGTSINIESSNTLINDLLSSKGMHGMLNTIWLVVCAMSFGGAMEAGGLLSRISIPLIICKKHRFSNCYYIYNMYIF